MLPKRDQTDLGSERLGFRVIRGCRVSAFPKTGAVSLPSDRGFQLTSGELSGKSGKLLGKILKSTLKEVPGNSPRNFQESSGKFWEVQRLSRSSLEPDSLPVTHQNCLQLVGGTRGGSTEHAQ